MDKITSDIYPSGPSNIPEGLTKPSSNYKKHAWLAVLGLVLFVAMYFSLAGWFCWTTYRLIESGFEPGGDKFMAIITGLPTGFLAIFMVKAIFFIKRGQVSDTGEIKPDEEPKLFEFLYRLADEAGAPRPHRVFVSSSVNACVFYDLTILNLFFPSKKNLEIGLGLVNVLNLGEIKAVLAHEFGHFAQKSMAVGSWVYVAHQIAAHIIAQRDILDRFLKGLSSFDLRIAWVGWILSLIVWSIRSLVETVFSLVIVSERALSREMEFQADLVSVSLTGSDALIHALHKLHAADEAWERTIGFINSEAGNERAISDVFSIQTRIIEKLGVILDDPNYGQIPPLPKEKAESHRIFKEGMATSPKMWATHPENYAREQNAKENYIFAPGDDRTAWTLFADAKDLRSKISFELLDVSKLEKVEIETSIKHLDKQYNKAHFLKSFRGVYLGRSITRYKANVNELYGNYTSLQNIEEELASLYPESLSNDLEKIRKLYDEKYTLEGIKAKTLNVSGGIILFRGKGIERKNLSRILKIVNDEILEAEKVVQNHDIRCRTVHLALAHKAGKEWEDNLLGLLSLLHYANHCEANLNDIHGYLSHIMAIITADDRVTKKEMKQLLVAANEAHTVIKEIYEKANQVQLGSFISKQIEVEDWKEALGEFDLVAATKENINEWVNVIDGWIGSTINALSSLSGAALENLLKVEHNLAKFHKEQSEIPNAPTPPKAPTEYSTMVEGAERKRVAKLSLWDRFYTADGFFAGLTRFAVAASIVGSVIFVGHYTGGSTITIYNGLASTVMVDISGEKKSIPPHQYRNLKLPSSSYKNVTSTIDGHLVEKFEVNTAGGFSDYVYNIAQAAPMVEWTQVYGNAQKREDRRIGAPRWFSSSASVLFQEPPESVKTKGGGATRDVLAAVVGLRPNSILYYVDKKEEMQAMIKQHVIWDNANSPFIAYWLSAADVDPKIDISSLLKQRLKHYKNDMSAMRGLQDYASNKDAYNKICEEHRALAKKHKLNSNVQYLSARCISDENLKNETFMLGADQWPDNSWFNYAAGYNLMEIGNWKKADLLLNKTIKSNRSLSEIVTVDLWRVKQLLKTDSAKTRTELSRRSQELSRMLNLESGKGYSKSPYRFYSLLDKGNFKEALKAAREMDEPQRYIRMLAASDGVPPAIIREALKFNTKKGIDASTVLISWSLAVKTKNNTTQYEKMTKTLLRSGDAALKVLNKIRKKGAYKAFENDLNGLNITERGYTYAAACALLGKKAPVKWKSKAKKILYASERPYFKI